MRLALAGAASTHPARTILAAALRSFLAERDRWPLWLPVLLGTGVLSYFALPTEPEPWLGAAIAVSGYTAAITLRRNPAISIALIAAATLAAGFAAAQIRSALVAAPVLAGKIGPVAIEGRVVTTELQPRGYRMVIDHVHVARLAAAETPRRIRVRVLSGTIAVRPGDVVSLRAELNPPPGPAAPGAYDFARRAWFEQVGAVGFARGQPRLVARADDGPFSLAGTIERLRQTVNEKLRAVSPGDTGNMEAALMTGDQAAISAPTMTAMRDSGLAHLLSISGLHFGLVAGILFFSIRFLLAAVPFFALHYPVKKWAAVAAFAGALGYLLISDSSPPAERSFVMIAIVLVAVLIDRSALSMRLIAWAALAILLLQPESVTGPSFQMSFGAVCALIAAYEATNRRFAEWRRDGGRWRFAGVYIAGVLLSTVIATIATAPYSVYHFNRLALYGLAANLVAVPLTSIWIMPWAIAAFILMPFGLESLALTPMGWGVDAVILVARTVAGWPGAVVLIPAMPGIALAVITAGGLWLCLWRGRWRRAGIAVVVAGAALVPLAPPPDLLVDDSGRLVALRGADGALALSTRRTAKFEGDIWLRRNAQFEAARWPEGTDDLACDALGCIWRTRGQVVALVSRAEALADDCAGATVVVSQVPAPRSCRGPLAVIDRWSLWRDGAHAIWLSPDGVRVESARGVAGDRPWVKKPELAARERRNREIKISRSP